MPNWKDTVDERKKLNKFDKQKFALVRVLHSQRVLVKLLLTFIKRTFERRKTNNKGKNRKSLSRQSSNIISK